MLQIELRLLLALAGQGKIDIRDFHILDCLSQGMSERATSRRIGVSQTTVRDRVAKIRRLVSV